MRIIDKQRDFYDYLQDSTDTLVFDRRNSFLLTKEIVCNSLQNVRYYQKSGYRFLLLQCGAYYWLILVIIIEKDGEGKPISYKLELLKTWQNYNKDIALLKLDVVSFRSLYLIRGMWGQEFDYDDIKESADDLAEEINQGNVRIECSLNNYIKSTDYKATYKKETLELPLLKASGLGDIIEPMTIFCAIEEYFSMKKTASETTEAKGATNNDKIVMHGFDTRTSFRGK